MRTTDDLTEDRIRLLLHELAGVIPVEDTPTPLPQPDPLRHNHPRPSQAWVSARARLLPVAVVTLVGALVGGLFVLNARRTDSPPPPTDGASLTVDLGGVDRYPLGSATAIEAARLFVVNDPRQGLLALSWRSPYRGCRLALGEGFPTGGHVTDPPGPVATFYDPCHGSRFNLDGTALTGPSLRGMYRFDLAVTNGQVIVDLRLAAPGAWKEPTEGGQMSLDSVGSSDDLALAWRDAIAEAASDIVNAAPNDAPLVWALGAFHDPSTDIVSIPITFGYLSGELQILPGSWPALSIDPDGVRLNETTPWGPMVVFVPPGDNTVIFAELSLFDGRHLRLGVLGTTTVATPDAATVASFMEAVASTAAGRGL